MMRTSCRLSLVLLLLVGSVPSLATALLKGKATVFGDPLAYMSNSPEEFADLEKEIKANSSRYSQSWDPDCLWRGEGSCSPPARPEDVQEITKFSETLSKETGGVLNFVTQKNKKSYRDFGALGQGFFVQKLVEKMGAKAWTINFSGDIYVSTSFRGDSTFQIADPLDSNFSFASISLSRGGWIFVSGGPSLGTDLRDAKGKNKVDPEFQQVVVVADPSMNGARLDAWATAIMVGGSSVVAKLESQKEYAGKWGYLFIRKNGDAVCSSYLKCDFKDPKNRKIRIFER